MYPIPTQCPVCKGELYAERLACAQCGTALEGEFLLPSLTRLTLEQWAFVETFIRCEGKLNRVQEELVLSYPTVRARLNEIIRALGYDIGGAEEIGSEDRNAVLNDLAAGSISVEEAVKMLKKGRG